MTTIDSHIVSNVQKFLGIEDGVSPEILYDQLYEYRNTLHPDRYQSDEQKDKAEERFKEASSLLQKLQSFIEQQSILKPPSELIPLKEKHDLIQARQKIIEKEDQISSLKTKIYLLGCEIEKLKEQNRRLVSRKIVKLHEELRHIYEPKTSSRWGAAISLLLSTGYAISTQFSGIADLLKKYSPIGKTYIDTMVFFLIVLTVVILAKRFVEMRIADNLSEKVISLIFIRSFYEEFIRDEKGKEFHEFEVDTYIRRWLLPSNRVMRILCRLISRIFSESTINNLKDQFISNLLEKQLVIIGDAKDLGRTFSVADRYSYQRFIDDDLF